MAVYYSCYSHSNNNGNILYFHLLKILTMNLYTTTNFEINTILGKCHFLTGGGASENWGDQVLCLRSKGAIKRYFQIKKGGHLYFLKK